MAENQYATVAGLIQFPVESRDLDTGQSVRDATIRSLSTGDLIRITFWPDFEDVALKQGDFIVVDGKVSTRTVKDKTYINMSARKLAKVAGESPAEREVVNG